MSVIALLDRLHTWQVAIVLAVLVLLAFGGVLRNDFILFDDNILITENPAVRELSWRTITYIFTSYDPELYVPLTLFSYQIEHALFGLNSTAFHATNLLLHFLNALLVYLFVLGLLRRGPKLPATSYQLPAFIAAFLFAIHPLHTETVAWAAARKDVLSTMFFLLACITYMRSREKGDCPPRPRGLSPFSLLFFFLGLLSKVTVISLPIVLLLIDWYQGENDLRGSRPKTSEVIFAKLPYFILAIIFGIIAIIGKTHALESSDPLTTILLTVKSIAFYTEKFLVPSGLAVLYPQETAVTLLSSEFILPIVLMVILLGIAANARHRYRYVTFGILFAFVTLLPNATNYLKNGFLFFASDRYAYIPSIGTFLIVSSIMTSQAPVRWPRWFPPILIVLVICGFLRLSAAQTRTWRNLETLFGNVLRFSPLSPMAHNNVGAVALFKGDDIGALLSFQRAALLKPDYIRPHVNIGRIYESHGRRDLAIAVYERAIRAPGKLLVEAEEDLTPFYLLAQMREQEGKHDEALALFERAAASGPQFPEPHYNLGVQYMERGRSDEAIREFVTVTERSPRSPHAHYRLAALYAERGMVGEAIDELEVVLRYTPGYEKAEEHLRNLRQLQHEGQRNR